MAQARTLPHLRRRLPVTRSLATAARWPVGVTLTSWRYMWRTTPIERTEDAGSWPEDAPPTLPEDLLDGDVQAPREGAGAFFHRRYRARVRDARIGPEALMELLQGDPDRAAPSEFATFKRVDSTDGPMRSGDEYVVRMPGPWDGPVRVVELTPCSFRLVTLEGHLEAGQIVFRASAEDGCLEFEIESWARSGDRLSDLLYDRLRMSKEVQLHMWISFLERVIGLSGGVRHGPLRVETRRIEEARLAD